MAEARTGTGSESPVCKMESLLGTDAGDGCTTVRASFIPLDCAPKNGCDGTLTSCGYYQNKFCNKICSKINS